MQTGITSNKMRDSACMWFIVKKARSGCEKM